MNDAPNYPAAIAFLERDLQDEFGCLPLREPPVPWNHDPYLYLFSSMQPRPAATIYFSNPRPDHSVAIEQLFLDPSRDERFEAEPVNWPLPSP